MRVLKFPVIVARTGHDHVDVAIGSRMEFAGAEVAIVDGRIDLLHLDRVRRGLVHGDAGRAAELLVIPVPQSTDWRALALKVAWQVLREPGGESSRTANGFPEGTVRLLLRTMPEGVRNRTPVGRFRG